MAQRGGERIEQYFDLASHHIRHCRPAPLVGNMHDVGFGRQLEEFPSEMI